MKQIGIMNLNSTQGPASKQSSLDAPFLFWHSLLLGSSICLALMQGRQNHGRGEINSWLPVEGRVMRNSVEKMSQGFERMAYENRQGLKKDNLRQAI